MFNIFLVVFFSTLAFAFVEPYFFIGYLISIALFGLYQAIFMANAGGAWDNAKKAGRDRAEREGTALHDACVIGDTVGDPFKDTSSVAMNPSSSSPLCSASSRRAGGQTGEWRSQRRAGGRLPAGGLRVRLPVVLRNAHSRRADQGRSQEVVGCSAGQRASAQAVAWGAAELCSARTIARGRAQRGVEGRVVVPRVWKPFQGFHIDERRGRGNLFRAFFLLRVGKPRPP